jgi:predicted permease
MSFRSSGDTPSERARANNLILLTGVMNVLTRWGGDCLRGVRYELRMLRRDPGFTTVAILTLALGIGANTAMFSVINSVLLHPLPFQDPERIVQLWETESAPGQYPVSGPDYVDWAARNHSLEAMTLYSWPRIFNARGMGSAEAVSVVRTQANFFSILGIEPQLGRLFVSGDDGRANNRIAILSYGFWQRHFGGRPEIVGKSVELDGEDYAIIGVVPQWPTFPTGTDVWIPLDVTEGNLGLRGSHQFRVLGKLRWGIALAAAQAELTTIAKQLEKEYPRSNDSVSAAIIPLTKEVRGESQPYLLALSVAVALVLLIACGNLAHLSLARAARRRHDFAVRAALGEGRWHLTRQLLGESLILSLAGGALGLGMAWYLVTVLAQSWPLPIPNLNPLRLDSTMLAFTFAVSVLVAVLFGLVPALQTCDLGLSEALTSASHSVTSSRKDRLRHDSLIVGEIGITLALLIASLLLLRSLSKLHKWDIGIESHNVLTMAIQLPLARYPTLTARRQLFDLVVDTIGRSSAIRAVAVSSELPLEGGSNGFVSVDGRGSTLAKQLVEWNYVTPDYFRVFGIPFLYGRNFSMEDIEHTTAVTLKFDEMQKSGKMSQSLLATTSLVAIINRSMAQTYWPSGSALGQTFKLGGVVVVEVIGVVTDVNEGGVRQAPIPQAYFPLTMQLDVPGMAWHVSTKVNVPPSDVLPIIRGKLWAIDDSLALFQTRTMDEVVDQSIQGTRLVTLLVTGFAVLAVVLSAVGVFGVMAYLIEQKTGEIGIRMALGAQPLDVLRLVFQHAAKLVLMGVAVGIVAALILGRLLSSQLFHVSATDPFTFVESVVIVITIGLIAVYAPARRALRVDPLVMFRYE